MRLSEVVMHFGNRDYVLIMDIWGDLKVSLFLEFGLEDIYKYADT